MKAWPLALAALALCLPASIGLADPEPEYDRAGNALVVANGFDGESYRVQLAQYARNGGVMHSHVHSDGFQEVAKALEAGDDGNALIGGVRYWQGRSYFWVLKYYPAQNWVWEWADDEPDCALERVQINEAGDSWVAGLCGRGNDRVARVARLDARGTRLWTRVERVYGARAVTNLRVDFGNRVSVTALTGQDTSPGVRTVVFGAGGERITDY